MALGACCFLGAVTVGFDPEGLLLARPGWPRRMRCWGGGTGRKPSGDEEDDDEDDADEDDDEDNDEDDDEEEA